MMRLSRWQGILAAFTFFLLVAATVSIYNTSHSPASYTNILATADDMTPVIANTSQDALNYETVVKQWLKDLKTKSDVGVARATLASDLTVVNLLTNQFVSALIPAPSLAALTKSDAIIAQYPQSTMPLALGAKVRTALDPSLNLITNIVSDVFTANQRSLDSLLKKAIATRQKTLNNNLYIIYLALFALILFIGWISLTFATRMRGIQSSIKLQLVDLEKSRADGEFTFANLAKFAAILQGQRDLTVVSKIVMSELAPVINAHYGAFYTVEFRDGKGQLNLLSSYAASPRKELQSEWKFGEGLVGQCALDRKTISVTNVPDGYIQISSGLGEAKPLNILVLPLTFEGQIKGVLEVASFALFSPTQQTFLDQLSDSLGTVINTIEINSRTESLLLTSQSLTNELQSQQTELRESNDQLEAKAALLEIQKIEVEAKNFEVEYAKSALEEKATQLELTSKYKSEFLSNMSHELRTPLNSLLILAQQLVENTKGHLDPKELEFAKLIETSGNDLLSLINEILDLAKIESGTVTMNVSALPFAALHEKIEGPFQQVAKGRNLTFEVTFDSNLPEVLYTDDMRLSQVMKNLLSNSFKFTEKGKVTLGVQKVASGWNPENKSLNAATEVFAFTVSDTGIGISPDKQQIIFEAFHQADGKTARKYGGTGLGLSISREIATLLGGELKLEKSALQGGSTFVLYVPQKSADESSASDISPVTPPIVGTAAIPITLDDSSLKISNWVPRARSETVILDDRNNIKDGDRTLLIIEDDPIFAKIVLDLAREKDFKAIVSLSGAQALELAHNYRPDAITLDLHIPDIEGWTILKILKSDPELRHIPVDIITVENDPIRGLSAGALQYLLKPISKVEIVAALDFMRAFIDRPVKDLLVVMSDAKEQKEVVVLLDSEDINIETVITGADALEKMSEASFDCIVTGTTLPDMSGRDFIAAMRNDVSLKEIPVVLYSKSPLTEAESASLRALSQSGVVNSADSPDRLYEQTSLFLHRIVAKLPKEKAILIRHLQQASNILGGKRVLIVDDDTRNIFALTAALESKDIIVSSAERGAIAIELLKKNPDIDLVLMDIMMPDMDGYETMREIRKIDSLKQLPIISLTAKAMVGDKEKCLEAGASDYLSKPVNIVQLTSMMQVWLSKESVKSV